MVRSFFHGTVRSFFCGMVRSFYDTDFSSISPAVVMGLMAHSQLENQQSRRGIKVYGNAFYGRAALAEKPTLPIIAA